MSTEASQQRFSSFCNLCEKVSQSSLKEKRAAIKKYIDCWKKSALYDANSASHSFYPALRLLCPSLEKERVFGFKEIRLGQEYVNILCLNKQSSEAKALTGYRQNSYDFSEAVNNIMMSRNPTKDSELSVESLNNYLDKISFGFSNNDKELVSRSLKYLVTTLSPLENKWLVRILIKNTKLGLGDFSILNIFHPQAKEHYDNGEDLKAICKELNNPESRSPKKDIQPFKPFSPMLAERICATHSILSSSVNFYIETKFDGERILFHKVGNDFRYYSRNGHNYSQYFNETFTPFIVASFSEGVNECVLDGEMLVYNENIFSIITKNNSKCDVKRMNCDNLNVEHPIYMVFDVLLLNKNVLSDVPLSKRKECLKENIKETRKYLHLVNYEEVHTKNETIEALNKAIENRDEGIMIKEISSTYKINSRKKSGWYKLKPEYVIGLVDDLDLLIVGGYYGEGRRQGIISQFLLAAFDGVKERFYSFCRVGSGYSDDELSEMLAKLDRHWVSCERSSNTVEYHKSKPDVLIEPKDSLILQIKGSEFTASDEFKTGFTLRFPRVVCIRYDKQWTDCTTVEELETLKEQGRGMLNTRRVVGDDSEDESPSKLRKIGVVRTLAPHFQLADTDNITLAVDLFSGRELSVINGSDEFPKTKLEELIKKYGGRITANPNTKTYGLVAHSTQDLKVKNMVQSAKYDLLKVAWLLRCIKHKRFLAPVPSDYLFMNAVTKARVARFFDPYGDSYFDNINEKRMEQLLKCMQQYKELNTDELIDIESDVWENQPKSLSLFRSMRLFVCNSGKSFETRSRIVKAAVIFYGGTLVENLEEANHVLIDTEDIESVQNFNAIRRSSTSEIVDLYWFDKRISTYF